MKRSKFSLLSYLFILISLWIVLILSEPQELFAQATNLALGRPTVASSVERVGLEADKAVDGNLLTRWSSRQRVDPQWIYVDLGEIRTIEQIVLRWETAYAESFRIDFSNDAVNWAAVSFQEAKNGALDVIPVSGAARYVRVFGLTRANSGFGYSLFEFEIYDRPVFEVPPPQTRPPDPVPGPNTVFFDDFEDGADPAWSFSGTWGVVGGVLEGTDLCGGSPTSAVIGDSSWNDYEVQFDFRGVAGSGKSFQFRYTASPYPDRYILTARNLENDLILEGGGQSPTFVSFPFQQGLWYRVRFRAAGEHIQVYIDNLLLIDRIDIGTQRLNGGIGPFLNSGLVNCPYRVQYDNVMVNTLREEIDLSISDLQPVQVVENADVDSDGQSDLVLGKPAVVRVYVDIENFTAIVPGQTLEVELRFQGWQVTQSRELGDLLVAPLDLFFIPNDPGDSTIYITLDPRNQILETDETNNQTSLPISVKDTNGLYIAYMPVIFLGQLSEYNDTVQNSGEFIRGVYPISPSELVNQRLDSPLIPFPQSLLPGKGLAAADLSALWLQGYISTSGRANRFVGVAPQGYFDFRFGCTGSTIGGFSSPGVPDTVIVRERHYTAAAHEIGHTFGLGEGYIATSTGPCSSEVTKEGDPATGYWVERQTPMDTIGFMGTSPGAHSFDRWATNAEFTWLFDRLRVSRSDPEVLLVSGSVRPDGSIETHPLYRVAEGTLSDIPAGDYALHLIGSEGQLIQTISFEVSNILFVDPLPPVVLDEGAFAFAIAYPENVERLLILHRNVPVAEVVVSAQLLHDALDAIPDYGFTQNPDQRRNALHNKVEAVEAQINAGAYSGAVNKLQNDIRPSLERWLVDNYQKESVLQYSKTEVLALVDEIIARTASRVDRSQPSIQQQFPAAAATLTVAHTPSPTSTQTSTPTQTGTVSITLTPSDMSSATSTVTPNYTSTPIPTETPTVSPTPTLTETPTFMPTETATYTSTVTATLLPSSTSTDTPTVEPSATETPGSGDV